MELPSNCIKGVSIQDQLIDSDVAAPLLFYFDMNSKREDGFCEQSINWEDDNEVIDFTLQQKKFDSKLQFKIGAAILPRIEIDNLNKRDAIKNLLSYERQPLAENPYHGNILLKADVEKRKMKLIAAGMALAVSKIIEQKDYYF